jgi:hypothetical protein
MPVPRMIEAAEPDGVMSTTRKFSVIGKWGSSRRPSDL